MKMWFPPVLLLAVLPKFRVQLEDTSKNPCLSFEAIFFFRRSTGLPGRIPFPKGSLRGGTFGRKKSSLQILKMGF